MTEVEYRQKELLEIESSQRQHHNEMYHYERMIAANETSEYTKFALLRPKIFMDGDQWCCLYGEDLTTGIAGFGDTPHKAVLDWNHQWCKSTKPDR